MIRILLTFLFYSLVSLSRGEVKYNKDVLPIFADKCFSCHGADQVKRKANLRLDDKNSAYAMRDGVQAILPGSIKGSEMINRIFTTDKSEAMPPPDEVALSSLEKATLKQWKLLKKDTTKI